MEDLTDNIDFGPVEFYPKKKASPSKNLPEKHSSEMSQEVANSLYEDGAFFLFLDVPERTEFGIDITSWNVGEKFKGLKMIPPGIHFVHYSAVSKDNLTAPRTGFFHNFRCKEVVVRRWDTKNEGICLEPVSSEEVERIRENLKNLDSNLGVYPYDMYKKWISLSRFISESTLERLCPTGPNQIIFSVQQLEPAKFICKKEKEAMNDKEDVVNVGVPDLATREGTRIRFSEIPSRTFPKGTAASEITRLSMDQSQSLTNWISSDLGGNENEVFAELQFAFVCFLVGQVYDAFEAWKKLISTLCRCEHLTIGKPSFYSEFINVLYFQLQEVPKDFFVDVVSRENFLTNTLQTLFSIIELTEEVDTVLKRKSIQFRKYLQKLFKWDFTSEAMEDAPVVVEL